MRILIVHGYLLSGTGSNLYVQNLARALCDLGNDVLLCCQDHSANDYDFVNQIATFGDDADVIESGWKKTKYNGSCKAYIPKIGKYLPVFVEDDYEKFEAKDVVKWRKNDIEDYIEKNVSAIRYILDEDKPDIAIAPSIYPEAFGLVGVEALASGILPIQADHSGFSSVIDVYQSVYENRSELEDIKRLELSEDFVVDLLDKILIVLDAYEQSDKKWRFELKSELRTICKENFSWSQTAQNIISLNQRLN